MRLLYIVNAVAVHGGLERILIDKVNWLAEKSGHKIHVVTFDQGNHPLVFPLHPNVDFRDINVSLHRSYQYSGIKRLLYGHKLHNLLLKRLKLTIREINPDIIFCLQKNHIKDIVKSAGGVPIVFESHSSRKGGFMEASTLWHKIKVLFNEKSYEYSIKKVKCVVALTQGDAFEWKKVNKNVVVIPNIVHLNISGRNSSLVEKKVVFVGRYAAQKDFGSLLQIWQIIYLRHPDWKLDIYGGYGPELEKWFDIIGAQQANVFAHHSVPDLSDIYIHSSMLLLTSLYEPFGLVIPEAMSFGLPVVSFDCPYGPTDIISHGVNGFLVKGRNIDLFANYVCKLIEDEQLRMKMGEAANISSQRYDADIIMPRWLKLFDDLHVNSRIGG